MNATNPEEKIEFHEERRLNYEIDLKEVTIVNTIKDLTELYSQFKNPSVPRSAPIPVFDEKTESILIIKPKLETLTFGDIQIKSIEKSNSTLTINYRETENWEFTENKWSDPIIILRVSEKPSEIQLNKIN